MNTIQVRRGANASLPTLSAGEFGFSTDTHQTYIGDGAANHELAKAGANADIISMTGLTQITRATGGAFDIAIGGAAGDDFTIDTDNLVVEGDSGNVGIGTTAPNGKLCINGGVTVGSDTDAGDNNLRVEGDVTVIGNMATQLKTGENDIKLDSLLSADGKYSGITCDGVLGATLAFGDLVYLATADQRWELADADAEATAGDVQLAIVLAAGDDGDTRLLLLQGFVREDDWNFTNYGQALFAGCAAGDMTQDISGYTTGDIVRVVGYASTFADQIYFNPSSVWIEIV